MAVRKRLAAALLFGAGLYSHANGGLSLPLPAPAPAPIVVPADAPNMTAVFSASPDKVKAKSDASAAGGLFAALADGLEYDGSLPKPRINTGAQMEDLRVNMRDYTLKGWTFSTGYSSNVHGLDFGQVVGAYLDGKGGVEGGPMNPATRGTWITAYRTLSAACYKAAQEVH